MLEDVVSQCETLEEAANMLAVHGDLSNQQNVTEKSLEKKLTEQVNGNRHVYLDVNEEDLVRDCFSFYKNPAFDPNRPIRVTFENQQGIDAGGLRRHLYSIFFTSITDPHRTDLRLFEGEPALFVPISTSETCLSEIFVIIGKIIAHNICQGGAGFPCLAPSVYNYLATGSIRDAMLNIRIDEVASPISKHFIKEVTFLNILYMYIWFLNFSIFSKVNCLSNVDLSLTAAILLSFCPKYLFLKSFSQ